MNSGSDYRILHATGEHIYTEDGTRLAYVWYTDEGPYSSQSHDSLLAVDFDIRHALKGKNAEINSSYDVLTGLPTMSYFIDLVNQWRRDHRGGNGNTAIVYINLCGMKHYNRRFGFAEGDHLLRRFSGILERAFSQENCSRFGSDHFCVFTTTDRLEETLEHVFDEFRSDKAGPSLPVRAGVRQNGACQPQGSSDQARPRSYHSRSERKERIDRSGSANRRSEISVTLYLSSQ